MIMDLIEKGLIVIDENSKTKLCSTKEGKLYCPVIQNFDKSSSFLLITPTIMATKTKTVAIAEIVNITIFLLFIIIINSPHILDAQLKIHLQFAYFLHLVLE